jgi:16S rRNA (guanine966-N2)-methyltransferase
MRIVAGKWAGRDLVSPGGRVRPTAEAVRDAWLAMLQPHLDGARVLEVFAGTGALGLEALSRGARYVDFVENGPSSLHALKANIAALRVREKTRVYKRDALPFAAALEAGRYDIVLADPPYGSRMLDRLVEIWKETAFATILSVEHAADQAVPSGGRTFDFEDTAVTVYPATAGVTPPPRPTFHATHVRRTPDPPRRRR